MDYNNSLIRRRDRLLDKEEALELLKNGEYGVLSMVDKDNMPYAVPLNFAYDGLNSIYIHCAPDGHKLNAINNCPQIVFTVVGHTRVLPSMFTTKYESILITGKASIGLPEEERYHALHLILKKYSPDNLETGMKYAAASFSRTEIIRIDIAEVSGKAKRL